MYHTHKLVPVECLILLDYVTEVKRVENQLDFDRRPKIVASLD
jgi:hypothetical protein